MKKLTSLLMLAALTSGALALSSGDSLAKGAAPIRTVSTTHKSSEKVGQTGKMRKHRRAKKKAVKSGKARKSRKGSRKGKKPTVVAPTPARQG